jgi:hypothetical protein
MNDNKKTKISWSKIIVGIIIYALFMLWVTQRNENESAQREFTMLTARAENHSQSTQIIEEKIGNCIDVRNVPTRSKSSQCVIGIIVSCDKSMEPKEFSSEPDYYYSHFKNNSNAFYLHSDSYFGVYIGECVMVWGDINVDKKGISYMLIHEKMYGEINLEVLPHDVCNP